MAKKALHNLISGGKKFVHGQVYEDAEVEGMDPSSFIDTNDIPKEAVKAEVEITPPELDSLG